MNTSTIRRIFATSVVLTAAIHTALAVRLSGRVVDKADGEPLAFASIEVNPGKHVMATDADGRWNMDIPGGKYTVTASYVGYATKSRVVTLTDAIALDIRLETSATVLGQVTVTARENRGITTSSRIDRSAMEHLQPTSFTDILELLPGGISKIPTWDRSTLSRCVRQAPSAPPASAVLCLRSTPPHPWARPLW